ncbi:Endonuclease V [Paenibacillus sp. P1XP2]|nr:Endonuclease V [Paenibacillus sp. P1XP2]
MELRMRHSWQLDESEAAALQRDLAQKVIQEDSFSSVEYVAGVDVATASIAAILSRPW